MGDGFGSRLPCDVTVKGVLSTTCTRLVKSASCAACERDVVPCGRVVVGVLFSLAPGQRALRIVSRILSGVFDSVGVFAVVKVVEF